MSRIIIGSDLVPTKDNIEAFEIGNINSVISKEVLKLIESADFRVFNLETPLADEMAPIEKFGPNLITSTRAINGIKCLNPNLLTLANNHILDQGYAGLDSTIEVLDSNNIAHFGTGKNVFEAKKPYIVELDSKKIGFFGCCEHEFSIAGENKCGANPFDCLESFDDVAKLKQECDYVVVLYHGGKEQYRYPSPMLQRVCRKFCKVGADVVLVQHTHCVGAMEEFEGSTIVYGQGNFFFGYSETKYWNTSLLVELGISDKISVKFIPLEVTKNGLRLGDSSILDGFLNRSKSIQEKDFVERKYKEFAKGSNYNYLYGIKNPSIAFKILNRVFGRRLKIKVSDRFKLKLRNYIECEAHRELLLNGLEKE